MSRLKLEPVINQNAVQKKLNVLAKRNLKRQDMYDRLKYKPVRITRPNIENVWNNPLAHSMAVQSDGQEISELLRMAKTLAFKTREKFPNSPEDYDREKDRFMRDYSGKISKYNLYTKLLGIFNLYKDPNYSEPMFDKDYLKQTVSNDYSKSIDDKLSAIKTARDLITATGAAAGVVSSLDPTELLSGVKGWADLATSTKIKKLKDADPKLKAKLDDEQAKLDTLLAEKERIMLEFDGKPEKAEAVDEINRQINLQQQAVDSIIAKRLEFKTDRRLLRAAEKEAIRLEEDRKRKEEEARKRLEEEAKKGKTTAGTGAPPAGTGAPPAGPPAGPAGAGAGAGAGVGSSVPSTLKDARTALPSSARVAFMTTDSPGYGPRNFGMAVKDTDVVRSLQLEKATLVRAYEKDNDNLARMERELLAEPSGPRKTQMQRDYTELSTVQDQRFEDIRRIEANIASLDYASNPRGFFT